jgi:hypothetical protein
MNNKDYLKNYYLEHKDTMLQSAKNYKANNKEKIKETNKIYRKKYNKLNILCPICKKLLLKSSLNRHNQRKHATI